MCYSAHVNKLHIKLYIAHQRIKYPIVLLFSHSSRSRNARKSVLDIYSGPVYLTISIGHSIIMQYVVVGLDMNYSNSKRGNPPLSIRRFQLLQFFKSTTLSFQQYTYKILSSSSSRFTKTSCKFYRLLESLVKKNISDLKPFP